MLIKEAYQRRIREETQNASPSYLKIKQKPIAIGSNKSDRLNFEINETFFSESDMPKKSKTLKNETKKFLDADIMQLNKKNWNISVQSPRKFLNFTDCHQDQLFKIKHGFYDSQTTYLQGKSPKIYTGTETRDIFKGWNVSVDCTRTQKASLDHKLTLSSLNNSILHNQQLKGNYQKPLERYDQRRNYEKNRSKLEESLSNSIKQQFKLQNPDASPEKTNASTYKLLQQKRRQRLKQSLFVDLDIFEATKKFKANLSDSQKINIRHSFTHNGCWSKVPWAQNGFAWSCCMNEDSQGQGCVKKMHDLNRPNYSSYNNS